MRSLEQWHACGGAQVDITGHAPAAAHSHSQQRISQRCQNSNLLWPTQLVLRCWQHCQLKRSRADVRWPEEHVRQQLTTDCVVPRCTPAARWGCLWGAAARSQPSGTHPDNATSTSLPSVHSPAHTGAQTNMGARGIQAITLSRQALRAACAQFDSRLHIRTCSQRAVGRKSQ